MPTGNSFSLEKQHVEIRAVITFAKMNHGVVSRAQMFSRPKVRYHIVRNAGNRPYRMPRLQLAGKPSRILSGAGLSGRHLGVLASRL